MCGRYYLDTLPETLLEHFSISGVPSLQASYNIAPTQVAPMVAMRDGQRQMITARWGLIPFWAKDPKIGNRMINARSETLTEKPAFRNAWRKRRCLVPASGFYEWKRTGGTKQPYAIHPRTDPLFAIGGLWETWRTPENDTLISFTLLTTRANAALAPLHDRMPVMIPPAAFNHWLEADDPRQLADLLGPAPDDSVSAYPVSREVNRPDNNHPGLLEPVSEDLFPKDAGA